MTAAWEVFTRPRQDGHTTERERLEMAIRAYLEHMGALTG